ncbi:MAG: MFS transporter [Syntrophotalea acetylenica]|jgi:predicted MFS family arabinose efflux permease|uniref:MFS transporter n=1 Tax=Syntrophotalea TaxID=2812025 RepID=UPI002A3677E7|nr:MFS transporter [Syntrophotalea acetylenica]MDD4457018.1 MFS transporter [Syntrophotalea acetylenica]MDY0263078.1 MFS transporter [Syntrophotalea acetylenica]
MRDEEKQAWIILVLGIMAFLANGDNYAVAPLILDMSKELNLSISETAFSVTSYMICFGFFTIFVGPLADRYGKTRIINIAAFGTAIFSILSAFSYNLTSLIVLRAFNGAFGSGIFPVCVAHIGESSTDAHRQRSIGKFFGMMFLGGASATAIGGLIAHFGSWRTVYFLYGFFELVIAFIMLKSIEKQPGVIEHLNFRKIYRKTAQNKELIKVVSTIFLTGFSVFGTFTYSGKFVQGNTGYGILGVGMILSLFGIATVIGARSVTPLRRHFNNRFVPYSALLGSLCLATLPALHSPILIGLALFGFGFAFISVHSTLVTTAQNLMPSMRGTVMSLVSFNLFVGGAAGTWANGWIMDHVGMPMVFYGAAFLMLLILMISSRWIDLGLRPVKIIQSI